MSLFPEPSAVFLAPLAAWFDAGRRELPWRARDLDVPHPDPYAVLVSELMLQQTQVATVIPYFQRWMARFPDPPALARAAEDEVHKLWEGLGYYRRARHLQAAARAIAERGWPADLAGFLALPGLGPYTAAAVASIAFQWPEPALDGNAFRVLARLFAQEDPKAAAGEFRAWLRPGLAKLGPSRLTQALMELGAVLCLPRNPRCGECPLAGICKGLASGDPSRFPLAGPRPEPRSVDLWLVAVEAEGCFLVEPPRSKGLLAGLWRWPALEAPPSDSLAAEEATTYHQGSASLFPGWTQVYTHRKERVNPLHLRLHARWTPPAGRAWVPAAELVGLPMGSRDQRLLGLLQGAQAALDPSLPGWLLAALRA